MKVLLVNTHEKKGGAGVASHRLFTALKLQLPHLNFLVQYKTSKEPDVHSVSQGTVQKIYSFLRFAFERFTFIVREKSPEVRFGFSPANAGKDISSLPEVKESDIIHLHWINQGFLSIHSLEKLKKTGKPVVWTLHDMWAFTGGCHYSGNCKAYKTYCHQCPFLKSPSDNDLSYTVWNKKIKLFKDFNHLTIVTCSNWLRELALESSLLKGKTIVSIPNCINTERFKPGNKVELRKKLDLPIGKKLILFGAMNTSDKRKGFQYLVEALNIIQQKYLSVVEEIELVVFGKSEAEVLALLPFPYHNLQVITTEEGMVSTYCTADVFVIPSLEDNLPNTVMESLACGIPVVAFETGGIPEMITHQKNGYIAKYKQSDDLADGIYWTLFNSNPTDLAEQSRKKVLEDYSMEIIAKKYLALYHSVDIKAAN